MSSAGRRVLPARAISAVCGAVGATAAAAIVVAALHDGADAVDHPVSFLVITLLLGYAHVRPTRIRHRYASVESDHLDEALFVPMVLMLGTFEVAAAVAIASLAGNLAARRAPVKVLFNVGQTVLACLLGYAVARWVGAGVDVPVSGAAIVGCLAGGLVFTFASSVAVAGIVRLAAGHPVLSNLWDQWRTRRVASVGALLLGLVAGVAVHDHAWAVLPAIMLGWTIERAHAALGVQHQARMAAEALQEAMLRIRNSSDEQEVSSGVLAAATSVLGAEGADLVDPLTEPMPGSLRAAVDDETALQVVGRIGGGSWLDAEQDALTTLATVAGEALRNARLLAHLTAITEGQGEGVLSLDDAGAITFANPAALQMVGQEHLVGRLARDHLTVVRASGPVDLTRLSGAADGLRDDDALLVCGERTTPVAFTAAGLPSPHGGVVLVLHDITERKAFEERLTYLAFHDPLTDLPNRRLFEDRLDHALARSLDGGSRHALLMIDLDRFKLVNDSYGHPAGDELLVQVADLLRSTLRRADTCARLGGDEFAVLIEDVTDLQQAVSVAERVLAGLASGWLVDGHQVFATASIGIALSDQAVGREAMIAAADAAGYAAKAAGKGRFVVFTPSSAEDPRARLELETALRRGLENGEFEVHYQPLVATQSGRLTGAEALVRWNSPQGLVPASQFIPLAEETGLVVALGAWVLEDACRQVQRWSAEHPDRPPLRISVNLSTQQINRPHIVSEIAAIVERTGVRPEQICLEITETVIMSDAEAATQTLLELKRLGLQMAIDDFGTGYSSLSYLKRLPVDVVKIDRTFTSGLGESPVDSEIVAAVIRLAAVCGITAVAEGVETREQRRALADLGCPLIQGYLISKPLAATEFEAFWAATSAGADPVPALPGQR